ncbi:MAG: twin-arginine translocase TatA/TatE family subunit [Candidatus Dormibacteria bacterium]
MPGFLDHWYILLILLVIVLIIWGPGKLPDVGAGMGRAIREFRKASAETHDALKHATATPAEPGGDTAAPLSTSPAVSGPATPAEQPATQPTQQTPVSR